MSSMQRLVALIVVWVSFALVAMVTIINTIYLGASGVITIFVGIVLGVLAATWMIRGMKPAGAPYKRK